MFRLLSAAGLITLCAATPAVAQNKESGDEAIVVTADRIQDYRDRLAKCLARNCPPDEDIRASTALAEVLFFAGDYRDARAVLRASVGRNRDEASRYPEPVSDLYRADSRVARHLGFDDEAWRSTREILRSLQTGLPVEDHRHFTARMEIVQSLIYFQRYDEAERALDDLAELATRAGRADIATVAELQSLWISYRLGAWRPTLRRLTEMSRSSNQQRSIGAKLVLIRMHSERGDTRRADALVAELGRSGRRRALLFEPQYDLLQYEGALGAQSRLQSTVPLAPKIVAGNPVTVSAPVANLADRLTDNFENAWIDVAFRIRADGVVHDVQIVRRGPGSPGWEQPLIKAIQDRRYSAGNDNRETLKIERYTYTSRMWDGSGSRIRSRSGRARVERMELSAVDIPA